MNDAPKDYAEYLNEAVPTDEPLPPLADGEIKVALPEVPQLRKLKNAIGQLYQIDSICAVTSKALNGDGGWVKSDGEWIAPEIPFSKIIQGEPDLSDYLLNTPDDFFALADPIFYDMLNAPHIPLKIYRLRIAMPKSVWATPDWLVPIKNLDKKHIDHYIMVEGELKSVTDPAFAIVSQLYACALCGEVIEINSNILGIKKPKFKCPCGATDKWRSTEAIRSPRMGAVIEDSETTARGTIYHKLRIEFNGDWAKAGLREVIRSGKKLRIGGIYRTVDVDKKGVIEPTPIQYLEANNVEIIDKNEEYSKVTAEEETSFKTLSTTPEVIDLLADRVYSSINGHREIKRALVCQIFGGVTNLDVSPPTHGQIHILLMGDAGIGKSELLKITQNVTPGALYACGKSVSGVGLTATVMHDEMLNAWTAQAGLLPMADGSLAIIDEFDKISKEDKSSLHEALAQYSISVAKATVHATFSCNTSVLAAANPKQGRFDLYESIYKQFDLPPTLVNRFDVIFPMIDLVNNTKDEAIIDSIATRHCGVNSAISLDSFKKYVVYARRINPKMTYQLFDRLKKTYTNIRNKAKTEQGITSVPITPRQVNAIIKFAQASARIKLRDVVQDDDLDFAIDLVTKSLDLITGGKDIDVVETGVSSAKRQNGKIVDMIFKEMYIDAQHKPVDEERLVERIIKECEITYTEAERVVEKKCLEGDWIRPRAGLLIPAFQQTLTEEKL